MKKYIFIFLTFALAFLIIGCSGKKEASLQEIQEPSMEELSAISSAPSPTPQPKTEAAQAPAQTETKLEPLPPSGPYKPMGQEIQTALKNANFYTGSIDGKIGPLTKKAIEEFQKANGLQVDGKVGPRTWAVLSKYLNPQPEPAIQPAPAGAKPKKR